MDHPRGGRGVAAPPRTIHAAAAASPRFHGISNSQPRRRRASSPTAASAQVRILDPRSATRAATRVECSFKDEVTGVAWTTVSVDRNIISASANALVDGFEFGIVEYSDACLLCEVDYDVPVYAAVDDAAPPPTPAAVDVGAAEAAGAELLV